MINDHFDFQIDRELYRDRVIKDLAIFIGGALPSVIGVVYYYFKLKRETKRIKDICSKQDIIDLTKIPFIDSCFSTNLSRSHDKNLNIDKKDYKGNKLIQRIHPVFYVIKSN